MRVQIIFLSMILAMLFTTPVFATENMPSKNNVFTDVEFNDLDRQWCGADGEFRITKVIPRQQQNNDVDFEVTVFSIFVNLSNGVVGEGFTQRSHAINLNNPTDIKYTILCYGDLDNSQNVQKKILVENDNLNSDSLYSVKINDKNLGSVLANSDYLGTSKIIEKNSSFLIVTGADACNSYGSFRMVSINHKESGDKSDYEIDISSLFFNRVSISENGMTHNVYDVVGSGIISYNTSDLSKKINLDNEITCVNIGNAEEKFELKINEDGQGTLNLPPIRSQN